MVKIIRSLAVILIVLSCCKTSTLLAGSNLIQGDSASPKPKKKLLYVVEGSQSYLIPYIERKLKNLRRPDSDTTLYDSVASLNILAVTNTIEATVFDILSENYAANKTDSFLKQKDRYKKKYSSFLNGFQSLLSIKVNPLQDLVEFQFTLYDIINKGNNLQYKNSASIFIDPRSSRYQADINRGLDQVFEEANKQPKVSITANINKVNVTSNTNVLVDRYFLTIEDTLLLRPIVDDESIEEDRIYFWSQDSTDKERAFIELSKKDQSLKNLKPGVYHLYFKVSNGINYSDLHTIRLHVYTKPLLNVSRPGDKTLLRTFPERLIIQEYVFIPRQIDQFSCYEIKLDSSRFFGPTPELWVKIYDKKGPVYVSKPFPIDSARKIARINGEGPRIIDNIDNLQTPMTTVRRNKYIISFVARNPAMESREVVDDLNVYQRRPVSLLYDVMIFPVDKSGLYHSWINAGMGFDLRLNKWLSGIAIVGTDLAKASFKHFYTNLIANFGPIKSFMKPFDKFEGGPALLINHDNGEVSTGFKVAYNFYPGVHTNLKIGGSYYNQGNTDYFAIHFTGDIFFNH